MPVWRILFLNGYPLYAKGLAAGLAEIGHEVRVFNPGSVPPWEQRRTVGGQIDVFQPDIVVSMGHVAHFMDPAEVYAAIAARRVYHAYWATEDRPFHESISVPNARHAHAVFTLDAACIPRYNALGLPAEVLPFACNPAVHRPHPRDPALSHDFVLLANNTPADGTYRQQSLIGLLEPLLGGGYDLAVWGYNWDKPFAPGRTLPACFHYGRLSYEEAARATSSAGIVLGPQWDAVSPTQVSCRTFEALAAGAFVLASDVPGVRHYFKNGTHLLTTDGPACTKAMIGHFLANENERRSVAARGREYVLSQHTYLHRALQFTAAIEKWRK